MKLRVLTLSFDGGLDAFDDDPARNFLADKELLEVRDHFFIHGGQPRLALVLTYGGAATQVPPQTAGKGSRSKARKEDWRDLLSPSEMALFNSIREWRSEQAQEEGVPAYVICTNLQLARMVKARPQSLGKLAEVEGFGAAKLKRYGQKILSFLRVEPEKPPVGSQARNG